MANLYENPHVLQQLLVSKTCSVTHSIDTNKKGIPEHHPETSRKFAEACRGFGIPLIGKT
jgi:hypothetical protein